MLAHMQPSNRPPLDTNHNHLPTLKAERAPADLVASRRAELVRTRRQPIFQAPHRMTWPSIAVRGLSHATLTA
jgi:hypothetical protein